MGILNNLLGSLTGKGGSSAESQVLGAVATMLTDKQSGGLSGLVQNFTKNGLGDIVSSWVGTGQNLPITADQIVKGLGSPQISQLAQKIGIPPETVSSTLANVLPGIVDKLTPNGKVPTDQLLQDGLSMLKGKLGV